MQVKKSLRKWMVFAILVIVFSVSSISTEAFAMYADECMKNPNMCQETNTPDAEAESTESASVSIGALDYIKILFSLAFVLVLLIMVIKFLNKRNLSYQQNTLVRNIGGISVGAQKSVQLLHIGNSVYIVGVGEEVRLLKEVESPEEVQQILAYFEEKQGIASTTPYIAELFSKFKPKKERKEVSDSQDFNTMFNDRIKGIKQERSDQLERWKEQENDKR